MSSCAYMHVCLSAGKGYHGKGGGEGGKGYHGREGAPLVLLIVLVP